MNRNPSAASAAQAPKAPRAYSIADWQRDFAQAFAAAVPLAAAHTQARGALLAAHNDEPEPAPAEAKAESPTEYAERRGRENDERALDLQIQANRRNPHCSGAY